MSTSWHIAECPPKIRAFPGIGVAADCLEEKDLSLLGDAWKFVSDKRLYTPWPKCFCCQRYHRPNGVGSSHTCDMVICEKTLVRHLPGICFLCVGAARIPPAKSFHPSVLTGLWHLSLRQELSVWHWHLWFGVRGNWIMMKLPTSRFVDSWGQIPCRC